MAYSSQPLRQRYAVVKPYMAVTKLKIILVIILCITVASIVLHEYSFCGCSPKLDVKQDRDRGLTSEVESNNTAQSTTDCYPQVACLSKVPTMVTPMAATNMTETTNESCFLLTMVVSSPMNGNRRNIIRRTWVNSYITKDERF